MIIKFKSYLNLKSNLNYIKNLMDRKEIQEAHEKYYPEYDAKFKDMKIETQCIHTGQNPDWTYGSVNVPIYATSTFELPKAGDPCGKWCYSRIYIIIPQD